MLLLLAMASFRVGAVASDRAYARGNNTFCPAEFADFTLTESGFTILIRRSSVTAIRPYDNPPQPYVHIDVGAQTYTVAGDLPTVYFKIACPL